MRSEIEKYVDNIISSEDAFLDFCEDQAARIARRHAEKHPPEIGSTVVDPKMRTSGTLVHVAQGIAVFEEKLDELNIPVVHEAPYTELVENDVFAETYKTLFLGKELSSFN